jgi:hypothetical protein
MMMLESFLGDMADTINQTLIPRFIDWNFTSGVTTITSSASPSSDVSKPTGTGKGGRVMYPEFAWGELTAEQRAAIQQTFTELASAGPQANVTPDFMLSLEERFAEELGLQVDYDRVRKQREQQQQQMDSQFGEGMTNYGPDGTPNPIGGFQQGGSQFGGPPMPGNGSQGGSGAPGAAQGQSGSGGGYQGGSTTSGGTNPSLLPQGFNQVSASAGRLLDDLIELSRHSPAIQDGAH